jgi:hypothetical protein
MPNTIRLGRTLLVTAFVALGIGAAWCMLTLWLDSAIIGAVQRSDVYEQLYASADGEPLIVRVSRAAGATQRVVGLDGKPRQVTSQDLLHSQFMHTPQQLSHMMASANWNYRMASNNDGGVPPIYWYLVHDGRDPGRAYGIGYHSQSKMVVGYFAGQGFSETMPAADQWFRMSGRQGLYQASTLHAAAREPVYVGLQPRFLLLADGKLWQVDLVQRQLKVLFDCPLAFGVGQAWKIAAKRPEPVPGAYPPSAQEFTPQSGLLRQPESLLVVDQLAGAQTAYPLPAPLRECAIAAFILPDGNLLVFALQSPTDSIYEIAWLSPAGETVKQQRVELATWSRQPSLAEIGWTAAAAAPAPLANTVVAGVMPLFIIGRERSRTYSSALGEVLRSAWPSIIAVLVASALASWATHRRQRRYGLRNAGMWAAFVFIGGIPAWLAYRFHRPWPVLEDCPACGELAPRDREACFDCGATFPPPPLKGIEVFA